MTVTYFYRKSTIFFSIERVFDTVLAALPKEIVHRKRVCRFVRGFWGRVYNAVDSCLHQSEVNHITGDVHYLALLLNGKKTVLTIHDCGILDRLSGWKRELTRLLWFEWPIKRVAVVTAISEASKRELLRHTSCTPDRVVVIPNPLPSGFVPQMRPYPSTAPRLLQVGTVAHKNLENAVRALYGLDCSLHIIGELSTEQKALLLESGIEWTSAFGLTDEQMLIAYQESDIVLFCSTFEGFGMPVIEAQGIGRPVIASDIEPIRSVAGGGACLVNPLSVDSIRQGLMKVMADSGFRESLIQRGFQNAEQYDSHKVAEMYAGVYRRLLIHDR